MNAISLTVEKRQVIGKGASRRLRRNGIVPMVLYGSEVKDSVNLQVDYSLLRKVLQSIRGRNVILSLAINGEKESRRAILKEIQLDPVYGAPLHIDLYQVKVGHKVIVDIPIHITGKAKGVEAGGLLSSEMRKLKMECLPRNIPEMIEIDVTSLDMGESIHVKDLKIDSEHKYLDDPDLPIVSIVAPASVVSTEGEGEEEEAVAAGTEE